MTRISGQPGSSHTGRRLGLAIAALALLLLAAGLAWYGVATRHDRRALALLRSAHAEERMGGAYLVATERAPRAARFVADHLATEADPRVRARYAWALGRTGQPGFAATVASVVLNDADSEARAAAGLALVRLDPARSSNTVTSSAAEIDVWDYFGISAVVLELGDARGVEGVLDVAAGGDAAQRQAASRLLYEHITPVLESIGRWPLTADVDAHATWPVELVREVAVRCRRRDLQTRLDEYRRHAGRAAAVQERVGKLYRARERLARLLFDA